MGHRLPHLRAVTIGDKILYGQIDQPMHAFMAPLAGCRVLAHGFKGAALIRFERRSKYAGKIAPRARHV